MSSILLIIVDNSFPETPPHASDIRLSHVNNAVFAC